MNWLLLVVAGLILFCAVRGWRRGLLRILYSLVSVVLLIGLISYATPYISLSLIHILPTERVERLADTILDARKNIRYCKTCYTLTDLSLIHI